MPKQKMPPKTQKKKMMKDKDYDDDDIDMDSVDLCDKDCDVCEEPCERKNVMTAGLMRYTKKKNKKWKDISINE